MASMDAFADDNESIKAAMEELEMLPSGNAAEMYSLVLQQKNRIQELECLIEEKDAIIVELQQKVDQYKSVLEQKSSNKPSQDAPVARARATGISAAPINTSEEVGLVYRIPKSDESKDLIKRAILDNEFLKNLDLNQVQEIVDCMASQEFAKHQVIVQEGEPGNMLYVLEEGNVEVTKNGHRKCKLGPGKVFGELAILYNCVRTATVRALCDCTVWAIDRQSFQSIMMKTGLIKRTEHIEFLKSIPAFKSLSEESICKLADLLEECHYVNGDYIIRQGAIGDTFYIIARGRVRVTQNIPGTQEEKYLKTLYTGDFFGEKALQSEDRRSANVLSWDPNGVDTLVINRETYKDLICGLETMHSASLERNNATDFTYQFSTLRLTDLQTIGILGIGGFARVKLVQIGEDNRRSFALKQMSKSHIADTKQEEHIMNEKSILLECNSPFICRMYRTFKDRKYLYLMTEPCLGGELWTLLRDRSFFDENTARFYVGCVIEALGYLHAKCIVYRDLKPENLLLDNNGFVKLVDFGFAKRLGPGGKTWTFCGTSEYVAPEVILNKGHDTAADLWSLGILIFELLNGLPPFSSDEPMQTYSAILRGINAVEFPKRIGRAAENLVKKLCRDLPTDRLGFGRGGINDIRKHIWFDGFNWDGLQKRTIKAPIQPKVRNATDLGNFDTFVSDDEDEPEDDISGWDKDF